MIDVEWKDKALALRLQHPELSHRELAAKCSVPVPRLKTFLSKEAKKQVAAATPPTDARSLEACAVPVSPLLSPKNSSNFGMNFEETRMSVIQDLLRGTSNDGMRGVLEEMLERDESYGSQRHVTELNAAIEQLRRDGTAEKAWLRYVRALSRLERGSEAYVWIADQVEKGVVSKEACCKLVTAVAEHSTLCSALRKGLYIEKCGTSYRVCTSVAIKAHENLSKERAVVPWDASTAQDPGLVRDFVGRMKAKDVEKINGLFPRTFEEIPTKHVRSLAALYENVRTSLFMCGSLPDEEEIQEMTRCISVAKLCAHDDGLHHFGSFYNHSCAPNCEVRGSLDLHVFATRDIAPGEELCISYLGPELDRPVLFRKRILEIAWGSACECARCSTELEKSMREVEKETGKTGDAVAEEVCRREGEDAWNNFRDACTAIENATSRLDFVECIEKASKRDYPELEFWSETPWKEVYVLDLFKERVNQALETRRFQNPASLAVQFEEVKALERMFRLLELRERHTAKASTKLEGDRVTLMGILGFLYSNSQTVPDLGLGTRLLMKKKMRELEKEVTLALSI